MHHKRKLFALKCNRVVQPGSFTAKRNVFFNDGRAAQNRKYRNKNRIKTVVAHTGRHTKNAA